MYRQFYGFSARPFENTPDPDFLFLSKHHREVLASLTYGITAGKGFILVVGDVGTGKTTLINALINQIDPNVLIIPIINPKTTFREIIHHISKKLDINPNGRNDLELVELIREKLMTFDKEGVHLALIIDEAHHLSKETLEDLRLISNIESEKKKLIQIALVGQIELYRVIHHDEFRQLKQRIILNRTLKPLSKRETFDYIQHRLNVAGLKEQIFSRRALNLIWRKSKGIPRVINQLCDNALIIGFAMEATSIGRKIIKEAIQDMESGSEVLKRFPILNWKLTGAVAAFVGLILLIHFWNTDPLKRSPWTYWPWKSKNENAKRVEDKLHEAEEKKIVKTSSQAIKGKEFEDDNKWQEYLSLEPGKLVSPQYTLEPYSNSQVERKIIRPGETLAKIAFEKYGFANNTIFSLIQMANPTIRDLNKIIANQEIVLPNLKRKDFIFRNEKGQYYIYYASFQSLRSAKTEIGALKLKNHRGFIFPVPLGKTMINGLFIGVYDNYSEAEQAAQNVDFKYLPFLNYDDSAD